MQYFYSSHCSRIHLRLEEERDCDWLVRNLSIVFGVILLSDLLMFVELLRDGILEKNTLMYHCVISCNGSYSKYSRVKDTSLIHTHVFGLYIGELFCNRGCNLVYIA